DTGHFAPLPVTLDPCVALACAERDHEDVRLARIDALNDVFGTHLVDGTESRRFVSRASQPLVLEPQLPPRRFGYAVVAAEEVHRQALSRAIAERIEQGR